MTGETCDSKPWRQHVDLSADEHERKHALSLARSHSLYSNSEGAEVSLRLLKIVFVLAYNQRVKRSHKLLRS